MIYPWTIDVVQSKRVCILHVYKYATTRIFLALQRGKYQRVYNVGYINMQPQWRIQL